MRKTRGKPLCAAFKGQELTVILVCLLLCVAGVSAADETLVFQFDFDQNGRYEDAWPLRVGEDVLVDIYISNVPAPGLVTMGFKLYYDPREISASQTGTKVNEAYWDELERDIMAGTISMAGSSKSGTGFQGNDILLGTVRFVRFNPPFERGVSELTVSDLAPPPSDDFVLDNGEVIDDRVPEGVLARIHPGYPGDLNGDGVMELKDAILALKAILGMGDPFVCYTADLNGDGKIGIAEAAYVLQEVAELRQSSP